jgi:hypothetical protein
VAVTTSGFVEFGTWVAKQNNAACYEQLISSTIDQVGDEKAAHSGLFS